tara:strand:+ start:287 stop:466 length:180 start_codon:yes stop_codon:yes gene_type:complete
MLKIIILLLVALIVYFIIRTKKGMTKIDKIFTKENSENMKQIQLEIQKKLDENKLKRKK